MACENRVIRDLIDEKVSDIIIDSICTASIYSNSNFSFNLDGRWHWILKNEGETGWD